MYLLGFEKLVQVFTISPLGNLFLNYKKLEQGWGRRLLTKLYNNITLQVDRDNKVNLRMSILLNGYW